MNQFLLSLINLTTHRKNYSEKVQQETIYRVIQPGNSFSLYILNLFISYVFTVLHKIYSNGKVHGKVSSYYAHVPSAYNDTLNGLHENDTVKNGCRFLNNNNGLDCLDYKSINKILINMHNRHVTLFWSVSRRICILSLIQIGTSDALARTSGLPSSWPVDIVHTVTAAVPVRAETTAKDTRVSVNSVRWRMTIRYK